MGRWSTATMAGVAWAWLASGCAEDADKGPEDTDAETDPAGDTDGGSDTDGGGDTDDGVTNFDRSAWTSATTFAMKRVVGLGVTADGTVAVGLQSDDGSGSVARLGLDGVVASEPTYVSVGGGAIFNDVAAAPDGTVLVAVQEKRNAGSNLQTAGILSLAAGGSAYTDVTTIDAYAGTADASEYSVMSSVQVRSDGGVAAALNAAGRRDGTTALREGFVLGLSPAGAEQVRASLVSGASADRAPSVAVTDVAYGPAGYAVTAYADAGQFGDGHQGELDGWTVLVDEDGDIVWSDPIGTSATDVARSVAQNAQGVVACGGIAGNLAGAGTPAGQTDAFVRAYAPSGTVRWTKRLGGPAIDECFAVALDPAGNVYVAGRWNEFTGVPAGGIVVPEGPPTAQWFVASFDKDGTERWFVPGPQQLEENTRAIALVHDGTELLVGVRTSVSQNGGTSNTSSVFRVTNDGVFGLAP